MRIHLSHAQASALHFPTSGKAIELYDVQLVASVTAIEGIEQQSANPTHRRGRLMNWQDGSAMRDETARLRADLRTMSERSNGSEWEQKAAELEELRAELNSVKQERDCAKSEWDRAEERCKELTEDIEVIRIELRESQKEAVTARQDAVTRAEADRVRNAELAVIKDERNELREKMKILQAAYTQSEEELRAAREQLAQIPPQEEKQPEQPERPESEPKKRGK